MLGQWILLIMFIAALFATFTIRTIRTFSWTNDQIESFLQKKVNSTQVNKKFFL